MSAAQTMMHDAPLAVYGADAAMTQAETSQNHLNPNAILKQEENLEKSLGIELRVHRFGHRRMLILRVLGT
jgi:hypothetical protein